jgi:hypothetical protein
MTEKDKHIVKKKPFLHTCVKGLMVLALVLSFLTGYNTVSFVHSTCYAQSNDDDNDPMRDEIDDMWDPISDIFDYTIVSTQCMGVGIETIDSIPYVSVSTGTNWDIACLFGWASCGPPGQAAQVAGTLGVYLGAQLQLAAAALEDRLSRSVDQMTQAFLERINATELKLIEWWNALWWYNWRPALQDLTAQMNASLTDQSMAYQVALDGKQANEANKQIIDNEIESAEESRASDNNCPTATVSSGFGRATGIGRSMKGAWQNRSQSVGSNKIGSPGSTGKASYNKYRDEVYQNMFCDPDDNGGDNLCGTGSTAEFYNADTQVNKFIFNKLTIPQTQSKPQFQAAVEAGIENLVGTPASDPIKKDVLETPAGQEKFLKRRSFMARHTAISSVPHMIAGARMPGSRIGKWVAELREEGGADAVESGLPPDAFEHDPPLITDEISSNPSYREIMHAITVDRFNSGKYAISNIEDENAVELEKLTLQAFYLIQLRDYYELLERTALTLAVQISLLADNIDIPPIPDAPKKN